MTVADILRERNTRLTDYGKGGEYWLVFSGETNLWTIYLHRRNARTNTVEFETEVEHQAVERFLALTATG